MAAKSDGGAIAPPSSIITAGIQDFSCIPAVFAIYA
jgi:hypothetical protein